MNDVDIFAEFLTMKYERNIKPSELALATNTSERSTYDWMHNKHIPDKYLDSIASYFKDGFFTYAVVCYKYNYPFIDFRKRYRSDSLSMILACIKEAHESDLAFTDLEEILSQVEDDDVVRYSRDVKEITESAAISFIASIKLGYKRHMTPKLIMIEGRS